MSTTASADRRRVAVQLQGDIPGRFYVTLRLLGRKVRCVSSDDSTGADAHSARAVLPLGGSVTRLGLVGSFSRLWPALGKRDRCFDSCMTHSRHAECSGRATQHSWRATVGAWMRGLCFNTSWWRPNYLQMRSHPVCTCVAALACTVACVGVTGVAEDRCGPRTRCMHAGAPWVVTTAETSFAADLGPISGPQAGGTLVRASTPGAFPAESASCSFAGVAVPGTLALTGTAQPRTAAQLAAALVVSCVSPEMPSASQVTVTARLRTSCTPCAPPGHACNAYHPSWRLLYHSRSAVRGQHGAVSPYFTSRNGNICMHVCHAFTLQTDVGRAVQCSTPVTDGRAETIDVTRPCTPVHTAGSPVEHACPLSCATAHACPLSCATAYACPLSCATAHACPCPVPQRRVCTTLRTAAQMCHCWYCGRVLRPVVAGLALLGSVRLAAPRAVSLMAACPLQTLDGWQTCTTRLVHPADRSTGCSWAALVVPLSWFRGVPWVHLGHLPFQRLASLGTSRHRAA